MFRIVLAFVRQYLFWMVFFAILRALFLVYHLPLLALENISAGEVMLAFWHAIKLDTATAAYILIIPALIFFLQGLFRARWLNTLQLIYVILVISAWSLLTAVELGIYGEWKSKLTTAAFVHLHNVKEAYFSVSAWKFFSLLGIFLVLATGSTFLFQRLFFLRIREKARKFYYPLIFLMVTVPVLFILLRGGVNAIPISQSSAHYSRHSILNWASVNSGYHFAVNVMETNRYSKANAYNFYEPDVARAEVENLFRQEKDTTVNILKVSRPNIVILLLESWTADLIESLGAEPGITPEFRELEREGLLFTQFYCTGNRSHEAVAALLGGYPALPYTTFTAKTEKFSKMKSMVPVLNQQGYHSSFFYGGQLDYGNLRAYLLNNQFNKIIEEEDISSAFPRGRLGVHDEYLYQVHIDHLKSVNEPFFSVVFSMSSHSPYDQPMEPVIDWAGPENPFINSAYYADRCLGDYFRAASQQDWYNNTLFILVADHGHNSYRNWRYESYEYHRIPLMFYGPVLREEFRGRQVHRISDNSSLSKTILAQLGLPTGDFNWSVNLFNPYSSEYAYMVLNDGYAWKTSDGEIVYSMKWDHFYKKDFPAETSVMETEAFIRQGKSYVQTLFQYFLDL